jgi:hypothetical protein
MLLADAAEVFLILSFLQVKMLNSLDETAGTTLDRDRPSKKQRWLSHSLTSDP